MGLELLTSKSGASPLICLEVNPPRGTDVEEVLARLDGNVQGVDFFNVTDSALAKMRMSPFPFAAALKRRFGIEPLVNLSCRDRNLIAIQSELLGAWAGGVASVVALTGDAVSIGDDPERKGVFETNSVGLLRTIATLNSGHDLVGHALRGPPNFLPGVVLNPNANNPSAELKRLTRKREAGAVYSLSQPVFDENTALQFFEQAQKTGVTNLMGLMAFKDAKAAAAVGAIPGIKLSASLSQRLATQSDQSWEEFSIELCLTLAAQCASVVAGFHIISGSSPKLGLRLCRELVKRFKA